MKKMVSIIVPVYNAEEWIKRCLNSITAQTVFEDLEVIMIDDGSTDASPQIIDEYCAEYPSFTGIHIKNQGVSNARNVGIEAAEGEYLAFVDADDYIDDDYFEVMINKCRTGADIVCSGFVVEYPNRSVSRCSPSQGQLDQEKTLEEFLKGDVIDPNVTDKLFRREVVDQIRFDCRFRIAEDKYFLFQCLKRVKSAYILSCSKYHYVMNDTSACRSAFSEKKMDSLKVAELVSKEIKTEYPRMFKLAKSMEMDVACRVLGEMYMYGIPEEYSDMYKELKKKIRGYSIREKRSYSSKKHFLAFLAARIHPGLYNFLKNDMKLQYKNG